MCLGMQEIIGTQGKAESEASSWGENGVCPCELFMEYEGMGRTNVGKGYTQMLLREKRDVKVMAKEVCTNAPSAPVTATAPHRWLKTIENKFADALRIPSLCRCP